MLVLVLGAGFCQAQEAVVFDWNEDGALGELATECRVLTSRPYSSTCTAETHEIGFRTHASVAQWADLSVDYEQVYCLIRRPGRYAIDCFTVNIRSNGDLGILREGYGRLSATRDPSAPTIELLVQNAPCGELPKAGRWMSAAEAVREDRLTDVESLRKGISWTVWLGIEVTDLTSPGEYRTVCQDTVVLMNQRDWLDENGDWLLP